MKEAFVKDFNFPDEINAFIGNAKLYSSDGCSGANTVFIDKDNGYFIKTAKKDSLEKEQTMYHYFSRKGLSPEVITYINTDKDYLVTRKCIGDDGTEQKYLLNPHKLSTVYGEVLRMLHEVDFFDCPYQNNNDQLLSGIVRNYKKGTKLKNCVTEYIGVDDADDMYHIICQKKHLLKNDVLTHGDYCLPNIILDDFKLSGFIDLGSSGVGDRHYDLFSGLWTLNYNLKTNDYADVFLDAYGRNMIDFERLKLCGYINALTD